MRDLSVFIRVHLWLRLGDPISPPLVMCPIRFRVLHELPTLFDSIGTVARPNGFRSRQEAELRRDIHGRPGLSRRWLFWFAEHQDAEPRPDGE